MSMQHRIQCVASLLAMAFACLATPVATGKPLPTNRLIVKFVDPGTVHAVQLERLSGRAGMALAALRTMSYNAHVLALPGWVSDAAAENIAARLSADPIVEYAEPDRLKRSSFVPNDTLYFQQWNLYEDAGGTRLPAAWDTERGSAAVVIAALDSGILPHSELDPGREVPGYDFITDPDQANDGDGRDADTTDTGDWVTENECGPGEPAESSSWHGIKVTGLIGATTDNAAGIAGVTHGTRRLMARVLGKCGGFSSDIIDALRWSAGLSIAGVPDNGNPARVINLSLGGEGPCLRLEQRAIDDVMARGAVVVVAAGNQAGEVAERSPASCAGVISVAATTRGGSRTSYTNTGSGIDLSAPGGDFADPVPTLSNTGSTLAAADDYQSVSGTSFAAAHVSGIAGLMLSANAGLNPQQVRDILLATARPFPDASCDQSLCGAGIVDADAAVQLALTTQGLPGDPGPVNDNGGGGGGGGGCSLVPARAIDPLLPLLVLVAAVWITSRTAGNNPS
jgi:serine protease